MSASTYRLADAATAGAHDRVRLVDLSHVVEHGMITYPGLPGPVIGEHLTFDDSHDQYAAGTEFVIGSITLVTNTGTYLDTPAHRHRAGHDLAELPLERCVSLPAVVIDAPGETGPEDLPDDVENCAVLLRSGWDRHWGSETYGAAEHPHLTADGATALVEAGAVLVGIDSVNIDDTRGGERPAHTILLRAEVPVVEHLTRLTELPARGATFSAVPVAIRGLATFPVRAFATVPDHARWRTR